MGDRKRLLAAASVSLLAVAAMAPAAAMGTTKIRAFQDLTLSGGSPGEIFVSVRFKDRGGNRKFTPRVATGYRLQTRLSCSPGGASAFEIAGNENAKYAFFTAKLATGRFDHRFGSEVSESSTLRGHLSGFVTQPLRPNGLPRRSGRISGAFGVEDFDPMPGTVENCVTSGSYAAGPCKRRRSKRDPWPRWYREWDAPVCSVDLP